MALLKKVSRLCVGLCFLCIILSTVLAVLAIWGVDAAKELLGKALGTLGVIFLGSFAMLIVNKAAWYSRGRKGDEESKEA